MLKMQSVVKRDKRKTSMCPQRKNVTFEENRGKSVLTQRGADRWAAPRSRFRLWKKNIALSGLFD